jgi:RNA polymerase sigma-54 factor
VARIQAETSLEDYLRAPLRAILTSEDIPIGEYLVGCLNEDGYLECELDEVALHFQVSESRVLQVLAALQSLDPPGVGARNLQECLMIQIRQLDEEGHDTHFAYEVVGKCWRELVLHSYDKIARRLKLGDEQVQDALEFIRKDLNPYPGRKFSRNWGASQDSSQMIRPDVIIRRGRDGFEVEVVESDRLLLKISDDYKRMLQDYNKHRSPESEEVRTHVAQYLSRAQLLIRSISQRRKTLQAITQCIIECQTEFFENGSIEYLKPLTRAEIAVRVSMHESTVSRATAGKFAQLPTGETISFDGFFNGSLRVKELIRQYISQENPSHPLTDHEIASLLQQQESIQVARRTVLKYREQMKILSSNQRRGARMTLDNPER